jgi:hypothetical protein
MLPVAAETAYANTHRVGHLPGLIREQTRYVRCARRVGPALLQFLEVGQQTLWCHTGDGARG